MEELVSFHYYSYKPRIRVSYRHFFKNAPNVGDFVQLPPEAFKEIGKTLKQRENIKIFGAAFKVVKKTFYLTTKAGEDCRIELEPVETFE
jgi:hypothetical protein